MSNREQQNKMIALTILDIGILASDDDDDDVVMM